MKFKLPFLTIFISSLFLVGCQSQSSTLPTPLTTITPTPVVTPLATPTKSSNLNDLNTELNVSVNDDGGKSDIQQLQKESAGL